MPSRRARASRSGTAHRSPWAWSPSRRATAKVADAPADLRGLAERIAAVCAAHGLESACPFAAEELIEAARHDKKRHGDAIDLVLPLGVASCTIQTVTLDQFFDLIRAGLSDKELTQA